MSRLTAEVSGLLNKKTGGPFLFIGSGFSRRYLGLEDWSGLLKRFCADIRDFDYYLSSANSDLPTAASLIANDFHDFWWKNEKYARSREKYKGNIKNRHSALKYEISEYLTGIKKTKSGEIDVENELSQLRESNIDGIITTNWDNFIEDIFPDYKVFIGQDELLFSNPHAIAEIYKIHGCASRPDSLVLTEEDYKSFNNTNPYLAAKLITLFIENPIVFIGYSVGDPHIQSIILSIASCLGDQKLGQFSENLLFLKRASGKGSSLQKVTFSISGKVITATVAETDDFSEVYAAMRENPRKIPARVLRYCKEQMYELVKSNEPAEKLAVVDIDVLDGSKEVEFVVGVGVAKKHNTIIEKKEEEANKLLSESGYVGLKVEDLVNDMLRDVSKFDATRLLTTVYPVLASTSSVFIPVFRYLDAVGIKSKSDLIPPEYRAVRIILSRIKKSGYKTEGYRSQYETKGKGRTTSEIIETMEPAKACVLIPFQDYKEVETRILRDFLINNISNFSQGTNRSYFRKLVCYYDHIIYGFPI